MSTYCKNTDSRFSNNYLFTNSSVRGLGLLIWIALSLSTHWPCVNYISTATTIILIYLGCKYIFVFVTFGGAKGNHYQRKQNQTNLNYFPYIKVYLSVIHTFRFLPASSLHNVLTIPPHCLVFRNSTQVGRFSKRLASDITHTRQNMRIQILYVPKHSFVAVWHIPRKSQDSILGQANFIHHQANCRPYYIYYRCHAFSEWKMSKFFLMTWNVRLLFINMIRSEMTYITRFSET